MSAKGRLLLYVMQHQKCTETQARQWLDNHCPQWEGGPPVPVRVIYKEQLIETENEEVADE